MDKRMMVSIENLEESQPTRPRHWIPVYCAIVFLICLLVDGLYTVCALNLGAFSDSLFNALPNIQLVVGTTTFGKAQVWLILLLPLAMLIVNLFALIGAIRMATYRKVYWWYAVWAVLGYLAMVFLVLFEELFTFVPFVTNLLKGLIPANIVNLLLTLFTYGNIGYSALLLIAMFFGLFYCVNYPAKYERIYALRKRHLKALRTSDERIAYRKRFYNDYRRGKWISMMLDLHAESLKAGQVARMDEDAYDFLVYYSCLCDSTVKKAVFDEYARNGRYFECRALYHEILAKAEAVEGGAKVRVPTYVPTVEPQVKRQPKKVVAAPPPPAPKRRHYRPDEI